MKWTNVKLIFLREVRDQLRDRRTLFTIAVLPLLLYPLLGMSFLQVAQFMHEQPTPIWIVGTQNLPATPALIVDGKFHSDLCPLPEARLLELHLQDHFPSGDVPGRFTVRARQKIESGQYAAVVWFPPGFAESLARLQASTAGDEAPSDDSKTWQASGTRLPMPEIVFDAASDKSRIAYGRVQRVLTNWRRALVRQYLAERNLPAGVTDPFVVHDVDVSGESRRRAAVWSKILPFVLLIWALTGAFYPAVDLCAGEKERGTLETLLSSPAQRGEIVWGKLLTIMSFSSATALLNLVSMGITGTAIIYLQPAQIPIGPPPVGSLGWLLLALIPISALFSALALAIAAFARSTKEGQYYLMPLLLISLPLMILPMLPAVTLTLGTSLVPITGMMLLLRALVEGQFAQAAAFTPPVLFVTFGCCLLAIRWAVDQFNKESVLFRESERWGLGLWLRHVFRTRGTTPTAAQAFACGVLLLTIRFFATFAADQPANWHAFANLQLMTLVGLVALPAVLMTALLTRSPRATLLLSRPPVGSMGWAVLLAVTFHPLAMLVARGVQWLYPINDEIHHQLVEIQQIVLQAPSFWYLLALMALAPAICEELAFRGFILSGLRHTGHKWAAIVVSSLFFGLTHGILQQSISAAIVGIVIGYIAVQTGSLLPGIAFHLMYNTLSLLFGFRLASAIAERPWLEWLFTADADGVAYRWPIVVSGALLSAVILWWFRCLPYMRTPEEQLHEALEHQSAGAAAS